MTYLSLFVECNSAVYYTGMIYLHNDIFLIDIISYDRLKFS